MSVYTEKMVGDLQAVGAFNYEAAVKFADLNGLKVRSVIAKVKSLGLDYTPKERVTKSGEPIVRKEQIINDVENLLGVEKGSLVGLQKSTKEALNLLAASVASLVS